MSEHAASQHPRDAARSYDDPHAAARSTLRGTAGPEDRDPVDAMQTEPRSEEEGETSAAAPAVEPGRGGSSPG